MEQAQKGPVHAAADVLLPVFTYMVGWMDGWMDMFVNRQIHAYVLTYIQNRRMEI